MRPRAIQSAPGFDPSASPFERLTLFARLIIRVPKDEAAKNIESGSVRPGGASKKK